MFVEIAAATLAAQQRHRLAAGADPTATATVQTAGSESPANPTDLAVAPRRKRRPQ